MTIQRSEHRAVVWARGPNGVPVTCACGWRTHSESIMGAYAKKRAHLAEATS